MAALGSSERDSKHGNDSRNAESKKRSADITLGNGNVLSMMQTFISEEYDKSTPKTTSSRSSKISSSSARSGLRSAIEHSKMVSKLGNIPIRIHLPFLKKNNLIQLRISGRTTIRQIKNLIISQLKTINRDFDENRNYKLFLMENNNIDFDMFLNDDVQANDFGTEFVFMH
ncbi:hypothetical protein PCE1_003401 [Barthelona sp. PCE]